MTGDHVDTSSSITRRQFLATVSTGAIGFAGCLRGPGPRQAEDPWAEFTDETADGKRSVRGQLTLLRGEYAPIFVEPPDESSPIIISYRASSSLSLPFDVLTLASEEFDRYLSDGDADSLSALTSQNSTAAFGESRLPAGNYVLVLDNTGNGEARPLDDVTIQFEMTVEYR